MNKVILMGRLTKDPDVRYSNTSNGDQMCIARYTLAVDRRSKKDETDFVSCVAFGKNGEFVEKFLRKGMKMGISGRLQTGSYEKDGRKVYTTDVVVEEHEFCESKGTSSQPQTAEPAPDGFVNIPDGIDEELPFV